MPRIVRRIAAELDLDDHAAYLQWKASPFVAIRFLEAANQAFTRLAEHPKLGSRCDTPIPSLADLRFWTIRGFRKFVILYRPLSDGIEVVRVVHSSQNLNELFGD